MVRAAILVCIASIGVAYTAARIIQEPISAEAMIREEPPGEETIEPPAQTVTSSNSM